MIIPSKMITVRHPSDPVHSDRISFCSTSSECVPALKPQQNTCMLKHEVLPTSSGCAAMGEGIPDLYATYFRHIKAERELATKPPQQLHIPAKT